MCKKPHKHADLIKAWADGAVIQCQEPDGTWFDCKFTPRWGENTNYRIKPEPKPDIIKLGVVLVNDNRLSWGVKVTLDGENPDILKSVEVIHGKKV